MLKFNIGRTLLLLLVVVVVPVSNLLANDEMAENVDDVMVFRPVTSSFMIDYGGASILDTYLTPITYSGYDLRLSYEGFKAMKFNPESWVMQFTAGVKYDNVKNIVQNRVMHSLTIDVEWGMLHRWDVDAVKGLKLYLGGSTGLYGGVIYNQYNSNNPVSVKIRATANLVGMATYDLKIGKLPITLRYEPTLPMIGAFFAPEYGEALYEVYLGNMEGLIHAAYWGNRFDMTNMFTADLHLGRTSLRIGYRGVYEASWVNNTDTRIYTNSLIVGVSGDWINLKKGSKVGDRAKVVSALY